MSKILNDSGELRAITARMEAASELLQLSLRNQIWRGQSGEFSGSGVGSSLDFQDHRAYVPGDDPRHINWQAYARTGSYSMKLYREEVRPVVDVLFDVSPSMFYANAKARRSLELFQFCCSSALRSGASVRRFLVGARGVRLVEEDLFRSGKWVDSCRELCANGSSEMPLFAQVPVRPHSLRLLVSDLLFPGDPGPVVQWLKSGNGSGLIWSLFDQQEVAPDWQGNYEFRDAETGQEKPHRVEARLLKKYRASYGRHFEMWKEVSGKYGVSLVRVPAEPEFQHALEQEALPLGVVEVCA